MEDHLNLYATSEEIERQKEMFRNENGSLVYRNDRLSPAGIKISVKSCADTSGNEGCAEGCPTVQIGLKL